MRGGSTVPEWTGPQEYLHGWSQKQKPGRLLVSSHTTCQGLEANLATRDPGFLSEEHTPPLASLLVALPNGSNHSPIQHEQCNKGRKIVWRGVGFLLKPDEDAHHQCSTHSIIHLEDRRGQQGTLPLRTSPPRSVKQPVPGSPSTHSLGF